MDELYETQYVRKDTHPDGLHVLPSLQGRYGVATISRLLKMIGLFCKRAL